MRSETAVETIAAWKQRASAGGEWDAEQWFHGADGHWHPILSRGVPVRNEAGGIVCWAGLHLDIRAFKESQQKLEDTNNSLARTNEELEQFAYSASHDLQEPLRVIRLMAHLLSLRLKSSLDSESSAFFSTIEDSGQRMSNLVRDLLDYSRVLHTYGVPDQITDLNRALEMALENCKTDIQESGAVMKFDRLPEAKADLGQMARVFQNLISNAIKYRRDVPPEITISVEERGAEWRFTVDDNGQGMPAKGCDVVFLPFRRLHGPEVPGSGIGLAVCKKIVERHGGRISVESQLGQGSCFHFTLPVD